MLAAAGAACDRDGVIQPAVWKVSTIIEASEADAFAAQDAIAKALCPDRDHPGYCPVPWTTLVCRFDHRDPEERAEWEADFAETRRRAQAR